MTAQCPQAEVEANWPLVFAALVAAGQGSVRSQAGAIGTICIETGSRFAPIAEFYNDPPGKYAYFEGMYGIGNHPSAAAMGNTQVGDGARYFGRGFPQITWKNHYKNYGERLGVDLVGNPDLALDPNISAQIFALYWQDRGIQEQCEREDWTSVRKSVQGGTAGLDRLRTVAISLVNIARSRGALG